MAISTLWMLSTVRPYHQRDPIFLPRLPGLNKLHNKLQTQKIPRNTTKWWRRRWPMGCRRLVGRRWTSASIHRSGLTLLTTTYMSRTSGFTTLVLVLSHTSQTVSSSRSHGHVFLRIYSVSILASYLLAFSVTSQPTASFLFTEQRDIWYLGISVLPCVHMFCTRQLCSSRSSWKQWCIQGRYVINQNFIWCLVQCSK